MISAYAELLAAKLGFDRSLSQRVREEVEDHLREAAEANAGCDAREAERRAIVEFGDAHAIAAELAAASLAQETRKAGLAVILIIVGVFMAMKARIAWYAATQWALNDDVKEISAIVGSIDVYAFWVAVIVGIAGWAYISSRPIPTAFDPFRQQLRRFRLLSLAATAALVISVIGDGVLTALRLLGTDFSAGFLIPLFSMALEIGCAGFLISHIRGVVLRAACAGAQLKT